MNRAILYLEFILGLITDMERKGISILCKFYNHQLEKRMDSRGIDPLTCRMRSDRSTI